MFMYSASFLEYILRMLYSFEDIPKIAVLLLHMQDIVVQGYFPFQSVAFCFQRDINMFAATPRFARGQSRISFDMLKSLRRVKVFLSKTTNTKILKPKTLKPKAPNLNQNPKP